MRLLIYFIIAVTGVVVYVRLIEATSIFFPTRTLVANPKDIGLEYQDVHFKTSDRVVLHGWFIPVPQAKGTVLIFHGNAGNVGDRLGKIQMFHSLGLNVFIMDYRGYGLSQGRPTEQGIYKDALAAYDHLKETKGLDKTRLIVYGDSLGGTAAIELASRRDVAALIVESTFTSASEMAKKIVPFIPAFLLSVKFDNMAKIKTIAAPKLFIHSQDDEMIPFSMGQRIYDAASAPKAFLKISGTHNEGHLTSERIYVAGIRDFLEKNNLI